MLRGGRSESKKQQHALLPLCKCRYYLLAAAVAHAGVAAYQTWRYNKLAVSSTQPVYMWPLGQAKLAFTGSLLTGYIYLHLTHFKFGSCYMSCVASLFYLKKLFIRFPLPMDFQIPFVP